VKLLLDTHAVLWHLAGDQRLSETARAALLSPDHELMFSTASLWEIAIKVSLGRLVLIDGWQDIVPRELTANQIRRLPIEPVHCMTVSSLPFHHRDPFDRMLIAQAMVEDLVVLSRDPSFRRYSVTQLW
jgi:PIN domain nuclease of toxin-antitoxin system